MKALPGARHPLKTTELVASAVPLGKGSVKAAAVASFREGFRTHMVKVLDPLPHGFRALCTCHGLRDLGPQSMSHPCHPADRDVTGPPSCPTAPGGSPGPTSSHTPVIRMIPNSSPFFTKGRLLGLSEGHRGSQRARGHRAPSFLGASCDLAFAPLRQHLS